MQVSMGQALTNIANMIAGEAHKYASQAINLTSEYLHVHAITQISLGLFGFLILGVIIGILYKLIMFVYKAGEDYDIGLQCGLIFVFSCLGFVIFVASSTQVFDANAWVALFNGKLALVQIALHGAGLQ